ncbi:MAG TPA: indolepyruvate ferredoxin oxidoreductase subunit alpha [Spirochaetota bacterium]|nr:indolepyruvate ferredoxin oxidoreductase subunit alpha [Spirochaetota bacterium]HOM38843.1 indolepyruvate ferredoxin oxidoreductase subunit alpha [Spirochaetota bacterium]HPQ49138.1 indolepyruvate ferredoxin oxidoreductase subunit alpha [Spirochaetota bacterium]
MRKLLTGNEAIARGAYEAGVEFASAYPGTPSTEILETIAKLYKDKIYCEWSSNEKTALEAGIGASLAGARVMVTMKHVGLNVAADPLLTLSYTGVNGALVIVVADDPAMHSSQNEQDTRHYARFAKIPILEPSDPSEAKKMVKLAVKISEEFDTPVILRTTTRVSHVEGIVELEERLEKQLEKGFKINNQKYVMIPAYAKKRHTFVEDRLKKLQEFSEKCEYNRMEINSEEVGIITSSVSYLYCKEVMKDASYLKIGLSWPLPVNMIKEFAKKVKKLYVVEELDRFMEENIKLLGIDVIGKPDKFIEGELDPDKVDEILTGRQIVVKMENVKPRPPVLCPGCPHRSVFWVLKKFKFIVNGDIGCYTLGTLPPLEILHTTICMGASIGMMHGMSKVLNDKKIVSVIGDSTFFHTGINNLISAAYNRSNGIVFILDNRITAMTGAQDHPGTGKTLMGDETVTIYPEKIAEAIGVKDVKVVDSYDIKQVEDSIKDSLSREGLSVIVARRECALIVKKDKAYSVNKDLCRACGLCLQTGCPALIKDSDGKVRIDESLCNGCSLCARVCPFGAISR